MKDQINVTRSSMPEFEEFMAEIKELWDTHWLTNMGVKHKEFAKCLRNYLNVEMVTLLANGHLALECAIAAFDLQGEVITTPFTFASTTHAIVRNGLDPVFCDINEDDYTIDVEKIESLITEKTCAIVPVHLYGNVCDVETIEKIAKKYKLRVIYDAAHAFGVTVNNIGIGNFGDASTFSFHATKVFNTIEGGAVTYNNEQLKKTLYFLKNFGITGPESVEFIGGNAKMNEFQAAMGICNLRHIDAEIARRQQVVYRYKENLDNVKGIKLVKPQFGVKSNYAYFPIVFCGKVNLRDCVFDELELNNIIPRKYFYPLTTDYECYTNRFNSNLTPVAKNIADRVLTLPLYADLELKEVDRICGIIEKLL
ncbi:DegT/DnrJ/EryC1/StrS aminotransferase family protein [Acetobacterium wieringae]|uniref:DegT/DnrJ/EryC1/StrS family aminotransferase n=1 Tax=Acetobacterium wieringae TaxID=52694 RepID=UPI0026EDA807|nr:DegT/DnrJ/EryC1/StrS family aminotransferase [Acetobacterium wieringae]